MTISLFEKSRPAFAAIKRPTFWFGTGFGIAIGVFAAAGFNLTPTDGARFVGAVLGAFIAVAGAFSLHFYKERRDENSRRDRVVSLLEQLKAFNDGIGDKARDGTDDHLSATLRVTDRFLRRCKRVFEKLSMMITELLSSVPTSTISLKINISYILVKTALAGTAMAPLICQKDAQLPIPMRSS